jgi:hypothetical protein
MGRQGISTKVGSCVHTTTLEPLALVLLVFGRCEDSWWMRGVRMHIIIVSGLLQMFV